MPLARQSLMLHSLVAKDAPLAIDVRVARETGYDGIELSAAKMRAFLAAGWSETDLSRRLQGIDIPSLAFLADVDRHAADEAALIADVEGLLHLAGLAGAKGIQVITGPVDFRTVAQMRGGLDLGGYKGVLGLPHDEQIAIVARNLARIADMAAERGMRVNFEALAWCPLNRIADQVEVLERAGRDNLKLIVDYWHCHISGDVPETVAALDKALIGGVHICDSQAFVGGVPNEPVLRDVALGEGVVDLQAWTDAVKSTGYEGWWSGELFCRKQHQDDSFAVAAGMKALMTRLIGG
jgi:sugar phosphate isomerase/epimerase